MKPHSILLVEDDESFGYILSEYLGMHNMDVVWTRSGEEALDSMDRRSFSLALLDIMLPGINGFALAEELVRRSPDVPFLFISAKSLKVDQLKGYRLGAFDYVTKPVDEELLVAKIRALLDRNLSTAIQPITYRIGKYLFDPNEQSLTIDQQIKRLTTRESELLVLLVQNKNQLLSRKVALKKIWGATDEFSRKSMDVFISHLRKHLANDDSVRIDNIHGKGFILRC